MLTIRNKKDFLAGALFIAFGLAFIWIARDYNFGNSRRMGPSFFPIVLSCILVFIGVIIGARGLTVTDEPPKGFTFKGLALVTVSTLLFGLLVRHAGVPVATFALVVLSAIASLRYKLVPTLALAVGLAIFCVVVFVYALGLPMPVLGPWLGG